jgi:DNA primase
MLCLDADKAGLAASAKSAEVALRAGMRVKAIRLPAGKDPADLASEDPKDFTKRVTDAQSIVEFFLSVITANESDQHHLVLSAEKTVIPLLAAVQSPLEREHFVGVTARALGVTPESVRASLARLQAETKAAPYADAYSERTSVGTGTSGTKTSRSNVLSSDSVTSPAKRRGEFILAVAVTYQGSGLAEKLKTEYSRITGASVPDEPIAERALFEAGLAYGELPSESDISDLVRMFEHAVLSERIQETTTALRRAELAGDSDAIAALTTTFTELSKYRSQLV